MGKWLIYGTEHHNKKQLQSLLSRWISLSDYRLDGIRRRLSGQWPGDLGRSGRPSGARSLEKGLCSWGWSPWAITGKNSGRIRREFEKQQTGHGDNVHVPITEVISQQWLLHVCLAGMCLRRLRWPIVGPAGSEHCQGCGLWTIIGCFQRRQSSRPV